ncbi:MAG: MBL fold metallo-hydrolase [Clostridia bacterium]|nr:MBL fold metallo-hydrolase [Clostridia bacterium]
MMKVVTLSSSSKGNSVLVCGENTNILIDAGISLNTLIEKLKLLDVDPSSIKAILSTHEHSDHSKSVGPFMRKYGALLYCHHDGVQAMVSKIGNVDQSKIFYFYEQEFAIDEFVIKPFKLPHDSVTCCGFVIHNGGPKFAYATDLGFASEQTIENLKNCKLVILESNHDEKMLIANTNYSDHLKHRILSKNGHLSNVNCAKVVCALATSNVKQVVLAHLSPENNTPQLCYQTVCEYLEAMGIVPNVNIKIDVAPQNNLGTVFVIK